jgi:methionine-gamma-lyase
MTTPNGPDRAPRAQRTAPAPRWGDATRTIRAASRSPEVLQRPTAVPIYQSATFTTPDAESLAAVAANPRAGYSYSRLSNPTTTALGSLYAELVDAEAGLALASGMAAIHAACASVLRAGDRVVAPIAAYGSTRIQLAGYFGRFGVEVELVDMMDLDVVAAALAAAPTRLLYAESSANPTTFVADHAALAELAHRHGALYFADNTFASPYVCQPLAYGADLVLESATKYLGGHNDITAGVVAGRRELVDAIGRVQVDTGATLAPIEAFLTIRGILTFPVRMDRHGQNALALAGWLERQDGITRVLYPGLPSHPQHAVVERQWRPGNAGGMLAFEVAGGRAAGQAVIDTLLLSERTASLGGVHTMVVHPASTSQRQLTDEQLRASGIGPGMLRVSVGLEDVEDLEADLDAGLSVARQLAAAATAPVPA